MLNPAFWKDKCVFVTGHTGFKGSWLSLWLHLLGAKVTGYSLEPPTKPSLYELCEVGKLVTDIRGDIRSAEALKHHLAQAAPDIVFHMAAQPLVRESYLNPAETYEVNVLGTVNVLEAIRIAVQSGVPVRAFVNVTTDKCYENKEWVWSYRENDRLGGYDPYSNSKACSELVTASYRSSFFSADDYERHGVGIATARAGNVIGGGDWAPDRLIPDCIRSLAQGIPVAIRYPKAVRPWQHVLEPLGGYLLLAQKLAEHGPHYASGWNFGPDDEDAKSVEWIVRKLCGIWGNGASYVLEGGGHPHEANMLKLDCSKAKAELNWRPRWRIGEALERIVDWTRAYIDNPARAREACFRQIEEYANWTRKT